MNQLQEKNLFESAPMPEAVFRLALPTVIGQIILVIYNMADTFFIGLTGDPAKVTALTICMPAFMLLSAISNLFGVGGASAVSRALGRGDTESAKRSSAMSLWGCVVLTLLYMLASALFIDGYTDVLGGTDSTVHAYAVQYIFITVVLGGIGTSVSALLSHFIRSEGRGLEASLGIALGGILNIALDPLFMFVVMEPGQEVLGAAAATALSNFISLLFFVIIFIKRRRSTVLSFRPALVKFGSGIFGDILAAGLPACIMTLCENMSYAVLDKLLSSYGVMVQAGIGVAKKINMLAHSIVRGMAQGMLPLIAYNYSSGNYERMKKASLLSTKISIICASVCMLCCLVFSRALIGIFLPMDSEALDFGAKFLRILCIGGPFSACAYTSISFFQAVGSGRKAFLLAVMRKGVLDIPMMFVLNRLLPVFGATWATPIADAACCAASVILVVSFMRSHSERSAKKFAFAA